MTKTIARIIEARPEVDVAPLSDLLGLEYLFDIPLRSHQIQPSAGHCEKNWGMLQKRHRAICSGAVAGRGIGKTVFCARDGIGGISGALWAAVTEAGSNGKEHASAAGLASGTRRKKQGKVKDLNSTDY